MNRPEVKDRHAKMAQRREVGMARITSDEALTQCSCGWAKIHTRRKVRDDAAERHVSRRHEGRALWM